MAVKPRIAIAIGDPAGIGPEIALKAVMNRTVRDICELTDISHSAVHYCFERNFRTDASGVANRDRNSWFHCHLISNLKSE